MRNFGNLLKQKIGKIERGPALIFIAGCLWGSIGLFIRFMSDAGASAEMISFLRVAFAFVILMVITLLRSGASAFRVSRKTIACSAGLGLICHGIYNIVYSWALVRIVVTISAVLLNVVPVFTAILSAMLFREQITSRKCIAILVNMIGCALAVTGGNFSLAALSISGILFGVAAGLCYGLTATFGRLAGEDGDPFLISTYSYLFAALFLLFCLKPWAVPLTITPAIVGLGFLYALIPTALGYVLYYRGVQELAENSKAPVIASVETVVTAILGMAVLGEKLSLLHYMEIAIMMASIMLMKQKKK